MVYNGSSQQQLAQQEVHHIQLPSATICNATLLVNMQRRSEKRRARTI